MPIGYILLIVASLLIVFGVGQRVLDRLRLTDRQALLFIAAIFIGGIIPDIQLGRVSFNIGGALIPFALCVFLFAKAGTGKERWRAIFASLFAAGAIFGLGRIFPDEPETMPIDINYIYGLAAGLVAYILGRSRRSAFIGGVMGVLLGDIAQGLINYYNGLNTPIRLGGAGALDVVLISGFSAVLLAEIIGEVRERMQGGSAKKQAGLEFEDGEFVHAKEGPKDDDD